MKVVIIIPTYNEVKNIGRLLEYLFEKIFPKIDTKKFDMQILVVDDTSPDGTAKVVKKLQKKYKKLHLFLNKKKAGLGGAYMKGMEYATDSLGAEVMFEMDADFSHDPEVIPAFLKKISQGYDLVLGSRYIKGGSIPKDWGFHRKIQSRLGNLIIRIILSKFDIHDWTTGYRALTTKLFQELRSEMNKAEFFGYTWQIGFLHKTIRKNYKVAETPIHFIDRTYGQSKLGFEYFKNTLFYIFTIRFKELQQIIKFAVVGTIGFIVNYSAMEIFYKAFGISPDNSAALGAELAIISNFTLNNLWTFNHKKIKTFKKIAGKFLQFNLFSIGAVIIQKVVIWSGIKLFGQDLYQLYFIVAVGLAMILNYIIYTRVIWKDKKN
jgi:dolichol-phosphate mannosyltransferase